MRLRLLASLAPLPLAAAVATASCSSDDTRATATDAGLPAEGGGDDGPVADSGHPGFDGGVPGFDAKHAIEQGYWYSRYNLGSLVMKSGLGVTFMPDMNMVGMMVQMVSDNLSTAVPPKNPALLKRVFNGGDPAYVAAHGSDPMDFAADRWAAVTPSNTSGRAFGWTVTKEVEWAKQFHVDKHFGIVGANDIPGAEERFAGVVLYAEAVMQAMEMSNAPGEFDMKSPADAYATLLALSDLALVTAPASLPHSASNRYKQAAMAMAQGMTPDGGTPPDMAMMFAGAADGVYKQLPQPGGERDSALAIQALAFYGAASATNRADVKTRIATYADSLASASPKDTLSRASVVHGLVDAARAVGGKSAWDTAAASAYQALVGGYDRPHAVFDDLDTYAADDIATILRALNAASLYAKSVDPNDALGVLTDFFESAVDMGALQIAAPPVTMINAYEQLPNSTSPDALFFRFPSMPTPDKAGGQYGVAPVFAGKVAYDRSKNTWSADTHGFDTAGAMHLANEILWFHSDEVDGFPAIP